jgi:DnaJ domain
MDQKIIQYYKILELEEGALPSEIKRAYRDLAMVWHPDRFSNPRMRQKAEEKLKSINAAYEFLASYQPQATQSKEPSVTPEQASPRTSQQQKGEVHFASYGAGRHRKDVTSILQLRLSDGTCKLKVNDVSFGKERSNFAKKILVVEFSWEGQRKIRKFPEGSTIYLNTPNPSEWKSTAIVYKVSMVLAQVLITGYLVAIFQACCLGFLQMISGGQSYMSVDGFIIASILGWQAILYALLLNVIASICSKVAILRMRV